MEGVGVCVGVWVYGKCGVCRVGVWCGGKLGFDDGNVWHIYKCINIYIG